MIATGTDVKPLECLIFMRNIRSLGYFEQMKGRGCRVVDPMFCKVSHPMLAQNSLRHCGRRWRLRGRKAATKPMDRKPSVPLDKILNLVAAGAASDEIVSTLASRLSRLDQELDRSNKRLFRSHQVERHLLT